jgi:Zn ribbon nucleic-acid-binding protein
MTVWKGEADCPKCGGEGTLMVSGETSTVEIHGCWVCGYGCEGEGREVVFVPLKKLRVTEDRKPSRPV